jgi:signal transduction histidine kinase
LCAIQCGVEMVERRADPVEHENLLRLLGPVKRAVENGTALTKGLLAFSRGQAFEPKHIDINRLVAGMSELLNCTLGGALRVETRLGASLSCCSVDPHQLENALLNLAVNARDAMPEGGTLTVETESVDLDRNNAASHGIPGGQYVVVSVSDTGTGMSPEALKRAFEPFFSTKPADRGTGLGLSQVYDFVKQSGGHVRIASELGQGTIVRIFLSAASPEETAERDDKPDTISVSRRAPQRRPSRSSRPAASKAPARLSGRRAAERIERIETSSVVLGLGGD